MLVKAPSLATRLLYLCVYIYLLVVLAWPSVVLCLGIGCRFSCTYDGRGCGHTGAGRSALFYSAPQTAVGVLQLPCCLRVLQSPCCLRVLQSPCYLRVLQSPCCSNEMFFIGLNLGLITWPLSAGLSSTLPLPLPLSLKPKAVSFTECVHSLVTLPNSVAGIAVKPFTVDCNSWNTMRDIPSTNFQPLWRRFLLLSATW